MRQEQNGIVGVLGQCLEIALCVSEGKHHAIVSQGQLPDLISRRNRQRHSVVTCLHLPYRLVQITQRPQKSSLVHLGKAEHNKKGCSQHDEGQLPPEKVNRQPVRSIWETDVVECSAEGQLVVEEKARCVH